MLLQQPSVNELTYLAK